MVKCGSCRISNANSYQRITKEHNLFDVLISLNPTRIYNNKDSYFCGSCVNLATTKLEDITSLNSNQNANQLSVENMSFTSNTSISSKDEYDLIVSRKIVYSDTGSAQFIRPIPSRIDLKRKQAATGANTLKENKPCPKRFKTREIQGDVPVLQNSNLQSTVHQNSSSQNVNSEMMSETQILLNVRRKDNSADSSNSSETAAVSNFILPHDSINRKSTVVSGSRQLRYDSSSLSSEELQDSLTVDEQPIELSIQNRPIEHVSESESDLPISTIQQAVVGSLAPAVRNPRVRQTNSNMAGDIRRFFEQNNNSNMAGDVRRYFQQNEQEVNVNHYSRTLSG